MTWGQQFAALAELDDGDAWETEHERLRDAWEAAYTAAFVEIAVARGWRRDNAETWPSEIADEAFIEAYRYEWDPRRTAEADVIGCEEEAG
jgi:hypothetical protein